MTATLTLAAGDALATGSGGGDTGGGDPGDFTSAWFIAPLPNAAYEGAPVTIDAEIGVHQGTDGDPLATVEVFVGGESIGSQPCADGCTFPDIELGKGVHLFELVADTGFSTSVSVYVDEDPPQDPVDTGQDEDGGATSEGGGEGGNGCSVGDQPISPWALMTLPLLLLIPGVRRRD
ncbi:hypothetical protein [Enhygromyxa salina]|uniref:hypothetical protein n=1 Tax=Enhygromyxa salina TaxID=215803 RepID=UPI000D045915|nr:hypothetical protein [Enhygromyxa salina]